MATYGPGTKHNELTGGTYVYTKTQCDNELDKKQDKLIAGTGIALKADGTISLSQLPKQEVNALQVCQNPLGSDGSTCNFDKDHKLYSITYDGTAKKTYKLAGILTSVEWDTMAEVTLLITISNPIGSVNFVSDFPITYVGDTDFSVTTANQTMWIAIRSFRERIILSKLGTF